MKKSIAESISKLDKWLETMRNPAGYTGPISHWWESSFLYTGVEVDWRYEGVITGYLEIYEKTGERKWLDKAVMAGEDVVANQLPSKKFLNSSFQLGPIEGGTPHEAAVDVGLLELAKVLKREGESKWRRYYKCAESNIVTYILGELWNGEGFKEQPWDPILVPNKNATTIEALLLYSELSGRDVERYVIPAADTILSSQIREGKRRGGIVHRGTHHHQLAIGIYTARCVSGLLRLFRKMGEEKYLAAAEEAILFLKRLIVDSGVVFGVYKNGLKIMCPILISPSGDVLRALLLAKEQGIRVRKADIESLIHGIIKNQLESGGVKTGYGFACKGSTREYSGLPEFRDVLPVVGWNDKVLRAFSMLLEEGREMPDLSIVPTECTCTWRGRECDYKEDEDNILLKWNGGEIYRLTKGKPFPDVYKL